MAKLKALPPLIGTLPPLIGYASREDSERNRLREREQTVAYRKWYKTKRWRDLRLHVLTRDLYTCQQTGVLLIGKHPASNSPVVDHIKPHKGDDRLFWDEANLQAVSRVWHDTVKQSEERRKGGAAELPNRRLK